MSSTFCRVTIHHNLSKIRMVCASCLSEVTIVPLYYQNCPGLDDKLCSHQGLFYGCSVWEHRSLHSEGFSSWGLMLGVCILTFFIILSLNLWVSSEARLIQWNMTQRLGAHMHLHLSPPPQGGLLSASLCQHPAASATFHSCLEIGCRDRVSSCLVQQVSWLDPTDLCGSALLWVSLCLRGEWHSIENFKNIMTGK